MKVFLAIVMILLPLGVMAAPVGHISHSIYGLQAKGSASPENGSLAHGGVPQTSFHKELVSSFMVAHAAADSLSKATDKAGGPSGWTSEKWIGTR